MFFLLERVRDAKAAGRSEPPKANAAGPSLTARLGNEVTGGGVRNSRVDWLGLNR
jgi:hypothetical protein